MHTRKHTKPLTLVAMLASVALIGGCAGANPTVDTSAEAEMTFDGLYPVKGGTADAAWARPDTDISQYSKIILMGAGIEYRPGGESGRTYSRMRSGDHFEIGDREKERLQELMTETFHKELSKSEHFTLVEEAGPDVLLIRGALLDVVSFVPPDPIGRGDIFLSSVGEATLVLEIRDSVSGAILARAIDRRAAEDIAGGFQRSNSVSTAMEVRQLAGAWARKLRNSLDSHASK